MLIIGVGEAAYYRHTAIVLSGQLSSLRELEVQSYHVYQCIITESKRKDQRRRLWVYDLLLYDFLSDCILLYLCQLWIRWTVLVAPFIV